MDADKSREMDLGRERGLMCKVSVNGTGDLCRWIWHIQGRMLQGRYK